MPVQIGAKAHHFTDPGGLLSDCHRRIEMFLGSLGAIAEVIDHPLTENLRRALESALGYFSQAAPKHTADEEESLFPRLREMQNPEVVAAFATLEKLEQEHRSAARLHEVVDCLGRHFLSNGHLTDAEIAEFRRSVSGLAAIYTRHITIEDELIFPLASRMLSDSEKQNVAREMAGRRNVLLITDWPGSRT